MHARFPVARSCTVRGRLTHVYAVPTYIQYMQYMHTYIHTYDCPSVVLLTTVLHPAQHVCDASSSSPHIYIYIYIYDRVHTCQVHTYIDSFQSWLSHAQNIQSIHTYPISNVLCFYTWTAVLCGVFRTATRAFRLAPEATARVPPPPQ